MDKRNHSGFPRSTVVLLALVLVLLLAFGAVTVHYTVGDGWRPKLPTVEEAPPDPLPAPVVAADGLADSILCRQTYTTDQPNPDAVVATAGGHQLTNAQLQIYYLSAVEEGRSAQVRPQEDIPLDCQLCPLGDGNLSWQHYYLQQALALWRTQLALVQGTKERQVIHEEAFQPITELHETYIAPELPVNSILFQDEPSYTPNEMHQAYLDGMEARLETLAVERGYIDLEDMLTQTYGGLTTREALLQAARDYNLAYMYFTEKTYDLDLADTVLEGPGTGDYTVNLRHVLLIPEEAKVAADGSVNAPEEQWEKCRLRAQQMLSDWRADFLTNRSRPGNFARLANRNSQDEGTRIDGGLYYNLHRGQLTEPLDEWCFAPDRRAGDVEILRSEVGIHIVYLHSFLQGVGVQQAEQQERSLLEGYRKKITVKPDFGIIELWVDDTQAGLGLPDTLYPDVAHERFPVPKTYLQQDYMYHRYGDSNVGRGGCGITTMGMLSTYMTDSIHSPAMLADAYGMYHDKYGTNGDIFRYVPEELGFYLDRTCNNVDDVIEALQNGQVVISLQIQGHFTSGGHYLLLLEYHPEDDTFQLRDSNVYNYGRLAGHKSDRFTRAQVLSGGATFWIMQKKVTRIPACTRCGGTFDQGAPARMLTEDYLCEKCTAAQARREHFLSLSVE